MLPAILLLADALSPPAATAVRAREPPVLDGRLDDRVWADAPEQAGFVQKFPNERGAPAGRTSFRVLYDDQAIYIGVRCEQPGVPIVARLTRRDRPIESDRVSIGIDARGDGRTAFEFSVNAAGVLGDAVRFDDTERDADWDENWDARVARWDDGWSAEIMIPLRILRFSSSSPTWGLEVRRYVSGRQETDEWAYIPRAAGGEVSRYGRLKGVDGIRSTGFFELRPFVLGRLDRTDPGTEALRTGVSPAASAGFDAKWHARSDLTLDFSLLPDFAQVEADRLVLNLTNEEIELPEKRPFFFEGRDIFATPLPLVYTRRIGRIAPELPTLRAGEALVDPTTPAQLLGATKLSGRLAEGLRVGSLSAVTGRNDIVVQGPDGRRYTRPLETRTLFQALRLRQELPGNTTIGTFASAVVRGEEAALAPQDGNAALCPNDARVRSGARCTHDAYVGAIDGRWRSDSGDYTGSVQVHGSVIRDGPPRIARDGTRVGSGDAGLGGYARFAKEGGVPWAYEVEYEAASRKLDFNDAGFMRRANYHNVFGMLDYRTLRPWFVTRETHTKIELFGRTSTDGLVLAHGYQLNSEWTFDNFWEVFVEGHFRGRHFDDREVGDGTALERRELLGVEVEVRTDPRKVVAAEIATQTQRVFDGFHFRGSASAIFRILPQFDLTLNPEVLHAAGEPRFVVRGEEALWFAKLRATELSGTLRATYTFTPRVSLQAYGQLFFTGGSYADFGAFTAGAGRGVLVHRDELDRSRLPPAGTSPNFANAALNANVVLRWEYLLGSTLYLVYTRSQNPVNDVFSGRRGEIDFRGLRNSPAIDTILVKLSYFFS